MNMKRIARLATVAVMTAVSGCVSGNGDITSEDRPVEGPIRHVVVEGDMKAVVKQGEETVQVHGDSNLLDYALVDMDGDTLHVRRAKKWFMWITKGEFVVHVATPDLRGLIVKGDSGTEINYGSEDSIKVQVSGNSKLTGSLEATRIAVDASGDSVAGLNCTSPTLKVWLQGNSAMTGVFRSDQAFVRLSGDSKVLGEPGGKLGSVTLTAGSNSKIDLRESTVTHVEITDLEGDSKVFLPSVQTLQLEKVRGNSKVTYKGKPAMTVGSITGDSRVKRED